MSTRTHARFAIVCLLLLAALPAPSSAQGTVADYQRAMGLRDKYQGLAINAPEPATWLEKESKFWYRRSVKGGNEFILVDAATQASQPAFDHAKLAERLTSLAKPEKPYTAVTLPFNTFTFADGQSAIQITVSNTPYRCSLSDYSCRLDERRRRAPGHPRTGPAVVRDQCR